jgi:undecaprenyl-diphosphatase
MRCRGPRSLLLLLGAASAIVFVMLAVEAAEPEVFDVDYAVRAFMRSTRGVPWVEYLMHRVSALGSGYVLIPMNVTLLAILCWRRSSRAFLVPALTAGSVAIEGLAKWIVNRPRPKGSGYGFPSGHVTASVVFFGALVYLVWQAPMPRVWRWVLSVLSAVAVLGIAYSRLYLNAHWLTDVLGALTVGASYLLFALASLQPPSSESGAKA